MRSVRPLMEFARFEGTSPDGAGRTVLNLVPSRLVGVYTEGSRTLITMTDGATHTVSIPEEEVIAEFQRADEAERALYTVAVESDEGPYRMKLDGSHRARGTYYPGFEDHTDAPVDSEAETKARMVRVIGEHYGDPYCTHEAGDHDADGNCQQPHCLCLCWLARDTDA